MMSDDLNKALSELSEMQDAEAKRTKQEADDFWNSLSEKDREKAFYAVVERLHRAEVLEERSFRGVIYGEFGFDTHMYVPAMEAGLMNLHNAIFHGNELLNMQNCKSLVVYREKSSHTWEDLASTAVEAINGKLVITINGENPYV